MSLTLLVDDPAGEAGGHRVAEVLRGQRGGHPVEGHVHELLRQVLPEQRQQEAEVLLLLLLHAAADGGRRKKKTQKRKVKPGYGRGGGKNGGERERVVGKKLDGFNLLFLFLFIGRKNVVML